MRSFLIKAGERRRILHLFSDSLAQDVRFSAEPAAGHGAASDTVSGTVEVAGSRWLFAKPPVRQPLEARNVVHKGMFDTRFSIYVTPEQDTEVTLHSRHFTSRMLVWAIGGVIVLAVAAAVLIPLLGSN